MREPAINFDTTAPPFANYATSKQIKRARTRHFTMLGTSLAIIVLSFLLQQVEGSRVALFGLPYLTLPETCGSRMWFGVECPGCGLTRSFIALAAADFPLSLRMHRLGWLLAFAVVAQIPYRIYALIELRRGFRQRVWPRWFGHFLIGALLINWLIGAASGTPLWDQLRDRLSN